MESNILFLTVKIVSIETDQMASEDALVVWRWKDFLNRGLSSYISFK